MNKEALKLAIQLRDTVSGYWTENEIPIIEKLIELLAQPSQEPVAWRYRGNLHEFDPSDWATGPVTPLYTAPPQRTVQVSPLEFVEMVMDKEHLVGNPIVWAQWPNKEKNT